MSFKWDLRAASDSNFLEWSYGAVKTAEQLYSAQIFGPAQSFACECGKYSGERYAGFICDVCGAIILADAAFARHERPGHVNLACPCRHPLDWSKPITAFPVVPVAFRLTAGGQVNALGRKYERLIECMAELEESLPKEPASVERIKAQLEADTSAMSALLRDIVGSADDSPVSVLSEDTLAGLLFQEIMVLGPHVAVIARSRGMLLEVAGSC